MRDVVDEIYREYNENIDEQISKDAFYKYFYNLLETGVTYTKFFNRKLIKEIDEEWLIAIEKAIPHLNVVVDNPRTFIEENRQVVNVAKAKKFTPEAVKHLSQHSEMISKVYDNGEVEPNRILNVFKEESMNTYENRFIYTLLIELRTFINKRADVIFDNSKNEDGVKLEIDSVIDNYTEIINYKQTVRIQEKQTDLSNDSDNINVFSRISKAHKSINDMSCSGFALEMSQYPLVKYPIVKTNAISKNPHYKACYELWNFIRAYDQIGYKVEMIEQDPSISQSFENDIYNMMLLNYVVVRKQMSIKDIMNIDKPLRDRLVGVNMIKSFAREIVNEFSFTESELKNLVLTELVAAEKEKAALLKKKEEIQKKMQGNNTVVQETANTWEDFTGKEEIKPEEEPVQTSGRKLSKKQLAKLKREKKEQERKERLKQLEEEKKRIEEINREQKKLEEAKHKIEDENKETKQNTDIISTDEKTKENQTEISSDNNKKSRLFGLWKRKK